MDHADKIQQNFEILGLESLEGISLSQLLDEIKKRLPSDVSKKRILSICTMWLHPRLMTIDISAEDSFHDEVGTWYRFLKDLVKDDLLILETFNEWQRGQTIQDPTSSRRLGIAKDKLRSLITASDPMLRPEAPRSGDRYGQMHPDRLKLSQITHTVIELQDDDDDEVVFISSNPLRKNWSRDQDDRSEQPDLSFLTGPNRLAMSDVTNRSGNKKGAAAPTCRTSGSTFRSKNEEPAALKKPRGDYVCVRCGVHGHFLEYCPTNLDPAFDRKPTKDYKCLNCGEVGDHFRRLCPMDRRPDSIAEQRRRLKERVGVVEEKGSFRHDSAVRSRDDRDSGFDDPTRGRARSTSPAGEVRKGARGDSYRPESDFSRLRLSSFCHQLCTRKASRSPLHEDLTSRDESREHGYRATKKGHRRKASFLDDLANKAKARREGRLSYDEEVDEIERPASLAKRTAWSQSTEEMEVDRPKTPAFEKRRDADYAAEGEAELFASDLLDMIRAESVKTDRLLLINGLEHPGPYNPLLVKLFSGKQSVWVNENLNMTRPCSSDFLDLPLESKQQVEIIDFEMAGDSAMMLVEPGCPVGTKEEDAILVDTEPTVAVDFCSIATESMTVATGSLHVKNDPSNRAKPGQMGVEPVPTPINDGSLPEGDVQESTPVAGKNNPEKIAGNSTSSATSAAPEAVDVDDTEFSPTQPADDKSTAVELMHAAVEVYSRSSAATRATSA
ncbi:hypothetical protein C8A03DRAFT_14903 [Achaetomium macrosporum]|uniref:CCHC-type domain-containing protein n=1 Tax=Achaetomium macrosporum TaxID=79813 RepID=A0AAN7HFS1_9PEZI|nr:hypothetical protein C8A03DRAFT_14903 [Achaetomium macrosporum]